MMSATASIGLVLLWDVDGGLTQIDKYLYSPEDYIKGCLFWNYSLFSSYFAENPEINWKNVPEGIKKVSMSSFRHSKLDL